MSNEESAGLRPTKLVGRVIVESPLFEAAVEKVQGGKERELSTLEKVLSGHF